MVCFDETVSGDIVKESVIIRVLIDTKISDVVETTLLVVRVDTIVSDVRLAVVIVDEWIERVDFVDTSSIVVWFNETVSEDKVKETIVVSVEVDFRVSDVVGSIKIVVRIGTIVSDERVSVVIDDEKKEKFGFVDSSTLEFCADETDAVDMVKDTVGICLLVDLMDTEVEVPSLLVVRVDTMVSDGRLSVVINDEG